MVPPQAARKLSRSGESEITGRPPWSPQLERLMKVKREHSMEPEHELSKAAERGVRAAGSVYVRWRLVALSLVFGGLLWCVPAHALTQRGHVFGFSFGSAGAGAGQLSGPSGVALNEETGDVYVVDAANSRVERFGPRGEFIAAWGWGVKDGKAEYEICEMGCRTGIAGGGKGQFDVPEAIAVDDSRNGTDPSRGDVYVVSDARAEHGRLEKFSATGEPIASIKQAGVEAKWEGALDGAAVDASGRLWVYRGVETEGFVERFSDAVKNKFEEPVLESGVMCPNPGFAVDATGTDLYADHERAKKEEECPRELGETPLPVVAAHLEDQGESLAPLFAALDPLQTSAIASERASGDAYLDNVNSVAAFDTSGSLVQRFSLPGQHPTSSGLATNATTGDVYVADSAEAKIDVFEPEPPGKPTISGLSARNQTSTSAELAAEINPSGADTHYYFQYGTVNCETSPASCTDVPSPPGSNIGEGFSDQGVSIELEGLKASTTYYYRIIATNEHGQAEGAETFGSITTLPSAEAVLPDGRAWEMVSPPEKDGSGIEPLRNEGGLIQASEDGNSIAYIANGPIVPEAEGSRAPYPTQAIATRGASGWSSEQIVTPRVKGEGFIPGEAPEYRYFSPDLSFALVQPDNQAPVEPFEQPPLSPEATEKTIYIRDDATRQYQPLVTAANDTANTQFGGKLEFEGASPDLTHVVFGSGVPLTLGAAAGLYQWKSGMALQAVSVLPDGTPALEPVLGAEGHNVRGAVSSDGSRVFWTGESGVQANGATETVRHLYMSDMRTNKTLQIDAAVPPIVEPGEEESEVGFQAANNEGTRVFFTDTARLTEDANLAPAPASPNNPADLYECEITEENGKPACTLHDLTAAHSAKESADVLDIVPGVSEDGSYVYFVANGVLAPGASPGHCVRNNTEPPPPGATCSLYLWHDGQTTFIASLSDEDGPDWGRSEASGESGSFVEPAQNLSDLTARVSPNGEYIAFMSNQSLTGYDSVDTNPAAHGAREEEVYLYKASSKLLVCVSCNPSGEPPHGVFDSEYADEGLGLLVDRRMDWANHPATAAPTAHWLAGSIPGWTPLGITSAAQALRQPRYLSNSGRLFFDSADPLVHLPQTRSRSEVIAGEAVQVGVENVYEFEPDAIGGCGREQGCVGLISSGTSEQESAFVDASTNGNDAFFVTAQPLLEQDRDTNFDLYDARVCATESPCLSFEQTTLRPCETNNSCRTGRPVSPETLGPSGSATNTGAGNLATRPSERTSKAVGKTAPSTRVQRLASALHNCRERWKHSKKRRAACERRARKTYGPRKPARHAKKRKK